MGADEVRLRITTSASPRVLAAIEDEFLGAGASEVVRHGRITESRDMLHDSAAVVTLVLAVKELALPIVVSVVEKVRQRGGVEVEVLDDDEWREPGGYR